MYAPNNYTTICISILTGDIAEFRLGPSSRKIPRPSLTKFDRSTPASACGINVEVASIPVELI